MCALLQPSDPEPLPSTELAAPQFPKILGAAISATTYGKRNGGDFYDCLRVGPERILFGLLDVAGQRESNQGILSAAKDMFRAIGADLFSASDFNESVAMSELCLRLNRGIMEAASGVCACPGFIGCYHEKLGTLCYTNAGHTPGLLRDSAGVIELNSTGLPLGLFSHATCDAPTVGLEKGAILLLVSRGVVEGKCKDEGSEGDEFGLERVKERLLAEPLQTTTTVGDSVLAAVGAFTCEPLIRDDMTALVLARDGEGEQ